MKWHFLLIAAAIFLYSACAARAQSALDADCVPKPSACVPTRDCSQPLTALSTRDCEACLVRNPFGGCAVRGLDPVCEAQKAASRTAAEAERAGRKADCERLKSVEVSNCRSEMELKIIECKASKGQIADHQATTVDLLNAAIDRNAFSLPSSVISQEMANEFLGTETGVGTDIRVVQIEEGDYLPHYASPEDFGFTVGNFVFVKDADLVSDQSAEFWLSQLETSRLYSEYGIEEFALAYEGNPALFKNLIASKVGRFCADHGC